MVTIIKLNPEEWHRYFNNIASALHGRKATVEVVAPDVGAQFVAEELGIIGITYDPKGQLLEVALDGMDHLIRSPVEIYVDERPHGIGVVEATDADGRKHIIQFVRQ
jgi:hypothetical protein